MKATLTGLGAYLMCLLPLPMEAAEPSAVSGIWAIRYHAGHLDPASDDDGDGLSNAEESVAGTDPLDGTSFPRAVVTAILGSKVQLDVTSQPEKAYQIYKSESPSGPWSKHGGKIRATSELLQVTVSKMGTRGFYYLQISDDDSDRDGLADWEENQLEGFDTHDDDSFGTGERNGDYAIAAEMAGVLKSGGVQAVIVTPAAYEKERTPAVVTFTRNSNPTHPFTVFFRRGGTREATRSSASPGDYLVTDSAGNLLADRVVIPPGQDSATLMIEPVADTLREVPEVLRLLVCATSSEAVVKICDAAPEASNQVLLLAHLKAVPGSGSPGRGTATLWLPGDNDIASLGLSFDSLRSPVSEIRVEDSAGLPLLQMTPDGYGGQAWPVRAGGSFPTDQEVLDALCSAQIRLSVKTEALPTGEIGGIFIASNGSIEFTPPPSPSPVAVLAGLDLDRDIVRFLTQASFGPTMAEVEQLRTLVASHSGDRIAAYTAWIDEQFALPSPSLLAYTMAADRQEIEVRASLPTSHPEYSPAHEPDCYNRIRGWWQLARHAPDQLRQRAAFALSEIFVVSDQDIDVRWRPYGAASYYDTLKSGASGTYRDLIGQVAKHPIMGHYLSHLRNGKPVVDSDGNVLTSPDENFARELMQLFSIGLVELHPDGSLKVGQDGLPIPTYAQEDVAEMARVFTGWSFAVVNSPANSSAVVPNTAFYQTNGQVRFEARWIHPMAMFPDYHDTGNKHLLGLSLPAGQSGEQDLADVADHLASHPNTAPFLCRRLIQRLVTANPSPGYLHRTSSAFTASGGNLAETIKAILLDPEARSPDAALASPGFGKKREPLIRHLGFIRAFDGTTAIRLSDLTDHGYPAEELAKFPAGTPQLRQIQTDYWLGQTPQSAPSVFNWFSPDYTPAGILAANGLTSPELRLTNENSVFQEINFLFNLTFGYLMTSKPPAQDLPAYGYSPTSHYLVLDTSPLAASYLAAVDTNGDGQFTILDTATFGNRLAIAAACEALVDHIDLLLCAGALKSNYGNTPGQPRRIILDAVCSIRAEHDYSTSATQQAVTMRDRIRNALWLVMSSPDAVIQK